MNSRLQKGMRWFWTTMLFIVWVPVFKVLYAFSYPDPGKKLAEALVVLIGTALILGLPAFILGFATGKKADSGNDGAKNHQGGSLDATDENAIYSKIVSEIESGNADKALWTKVFAQSLGDENRTKATYIQRRAEALIAARQAELSNKPSAPLLGAVQTHAKSSAWLGWLWLGIVGVVGVIAATMFTANPETKSRGSRQIESIQIVESDISFDPNHSMVLVLKASLSNTATNSQDYPWLELTLTDSAEHVIARRVIDPDLYLGTPRQSNFRSGSNLLLSLRFDTSMLSEYGVLQGYRLYLFYPSDEPSRRDDQVNPDAVILIGK